MDYSDKWCDDISDIIKESKMCQKNKQRIEERLVEGTSTRWKEHVNNVWKQHKLDTKIAELFDRKSQANAQSAAAWRRYGRTPEEQTQSIRVTCLVDLAVDMEITLANQRKVLQVRTNSMLMG